MQMLRDLGGDAARARACGSRRDPGESRTRRGHRGCPATCVRDAQAGMPGFTFREDQSPGHGCRAGLSAACGVEVPVVQLSHTLSLHNRKGLKRYRGL